MRNILRVSAAFALIQGLALGLAPHASAQSTRQIGLGETLRGELQSSDPTLEDGSYYDVYQFQAIAGQSFVVTLESDDFDPYLRVTGPGGLEGENDDGEDGSLNARLEFTVPESGIVDITANSFEEGEVGRYSVTLRAGAASRTIAFGETLSGELGPESPMTDGTPYQPFVFQGREDQTITISMGSADFDAYLVLRRVGSTDELASNDDGGGGTNAELVYSLPRDGTYEIRANALVAETGGGFTLTLKDGVETREAVKQPITFGRVIRTELTGASGRDNAGLAFDAYTFTGQRGDRVTISAISSDFDPMLFLGVQGADDEWLATNDDGEYGTDSEIVFTLPRNGAYEFHVVSYGVGEMGDYIVGLSRE